MLTLRGLDRVLGDLSEMGYDARWGVVGAYHVGAPHRRERIWILANSTQLFSNGSDDNSRVGLEREAQSKLGNDCWTKDVADSKRFRSHSKENEQILGRTGASQLCVEQPRNHWSNWWEIEPELGRVADGVANRVDRLKAIGNGQVPLVAATAWRILGGE